MNKNENSPIQTKKQSLVKKSNSPLDKYTIKSRPVTTQAFIKNSVIKKTSSIPKTVYAITEPYDTFDIPDLKQNSSQNKCAKNINDLRHLITTVPSVGNSGLKWMINLRNHPFKKQEKIPTEEDNIDSDNKQSNNNNEKEKTVINFNAPSFYDDDLSKYKTRNNFFKNKRPLSTKLNPNFVEISHLVNNRLGESVNSTQYNFETTLRINKLKSIINNKHKWNNIPNKLNTNTYNECLPPCNEKSIENMNKLEKYTSRPFQVMFDKTFIGKSQIRTKKLVKDKLRKSPYLGEHLSSRPYSNKYQDAETFRNHEIMQKHNNTMCLFELCLRHYGPIERKAIKRKGNEEIKKMKRNIVENKRKEFMKLKEKRDNIWNNKS